MSEAEHVIGIDLGTTHTALAWAAPAKGDAVHAERITQLVTATELDDRALLPSFVYFAHESEGALPLPWDAARRHAVGEYARSRGVEAPTRLVASAKSWLSHTGIDRRAGVLPLGAPDEIDKISPVEAAWHYLDHLGEAWNATHGCSLADQEIIITVPASFDAAARDLTVEAAYAAGFEEVSLLEEPQAALYAWIEGTGAAWRQHLGVGEVILVIDIGGGTTDFSAMVVREREGELELHRVAVGDHILLGGDNMDLALAHVVKAKLATEGTELDRWQMTALTHGCRQAKERILFDASIDAVPITIPSRGSQLLGGSLRAELSRSEVERTLLDGFFPEVDATARPATRARTALTQVGLPYAADPAITRHLASFLTRQASATGSEQREMLTPSRVLFNGGVLKATALRERLLSVLSAWVRDAGAPAPRVLPGEDLDLAVARGAAYYGLVRRGRGLRIRGGTARAYYVGVESPAPAVPGVEPPINALCVAPFGMEEGTEAPLPPHQLGVVVGEPVRFRFFATSVRRDDRAGTQLEDWSPEELEEVAPIEVTLPADGREEGDVVSVRLHASVTPVGTLLLEAEPLEPVVEGERWKVELSVRTPD